MLSSPSSPSAGPSLAPEGGGGGGGGGWGSISVCQVISPLTACKRDVFHPISCHWTGNYDDIFAHLYQRLEMRTSLAIFMPLFAPQHSVY